MLSRLKKNYPNEFVVAGQIGTYYVCWNVNENILPAELGLSGAEYILLGVCLVAILGVSLFKYHKGSVRDALYRKPAPVFYGVMLLLLCSILIFGAYGIGFDSSQFIYNQF